MENNYNQQTDTNSYQQGNPYQPNDPYANPYSGSGYGNYGSSYNYGGSQEPEKAPNIFQQFVMAFIPPRYGSLARVKTGSMIGFVTLLVLIATILSFVGMAVAFGSVDWENQIPDFEITDGRLYIEEDFVYDNYGLFLYMTDDISSFDRKTAQDVASEGYQNVILIGRDTLSVLQNGQYQEGDFRTMDSSIKISREWIVDTLLPVMMIFIAIGYIIVFVWRVLWYFLCAAVYMLFAMLIATCMKKQVSSRALLRVAVYSKVLMFVVATLLSLVPFASLSVPFILRVAITMGFMGFAITKLPEKI